MATQDLPATHIYPRSDARPLVPARVAELAASIKELQLLNPIVVRPAKRFRDGIQTDVWEIMAGHHRYQACSVNLGMEIIPCTVRDEDDLRAELVMIDENLCRADLTPAQAAWTTQRRKDIYEMLHPETTNGGITGGRAGRTKDGFAKLAKPNGEAADRFSFSTAKATGRPERIVQRDAARGKKLGDDLNRIQGTSLDKGVELDALARLQPKQREAVVARAQSGEKVSARELVGEPERLQREPKASPAPQPSPLAAAPSKMPEPLFAKAATPAPSRSAGMIDEFETFIDERVDEVDLPRLLRFVETLSLDAITGAIKRLMA